jgi:amidase
MLIPADPVHAFVDYPDVPVTNATSGPLVALTFAVKDIFDVAGYPTGCGSPEKTAEDPVPKKHAAVVSKLLDAGARFVGKTHTAEIAFSLDGRNEHYGTPLNPAAPGRVPGGSSSGSAAATAAGLVDFARGSDTGGSVRGPASFCGIIGLRPSWGRIDISGAMPLASNFDTVGWFARSMEVYERVGAVLLGEDAAAPALSRFVVASDARATFAATNDVAQFDAIVGRLQSLLKPAGSVVMAEGEGVGGNDTYRVMQGWEAWRVHGPWIENRKPDLNPAVRVRMAAAKAVTKEQYDAAAVRRAALKRHLAGILGRDGVIVLPTMPGIAPRLDAPEAEFETFRSRALSMLCVAGLCELPQLSLPMMTVDGCPVGVSLIAPHGRDQALLALGRRLLAA